MSHPALEKIRKRRSLRREYLERRLSTKGSEATPGRYSHDGLDMSGVAPSDKERAELLAELHEMNREDGW